MIKCITFDLDDTLWKIEPVINRAEIFFQKWLDSNYPIVSEKFNIELLRKLMRQTSLENPEINHDLTKIRIKAYTKLKDFYDSSSDTRIIQVVDSAGLVLDTNAGSVNETAGTITLNSFNPTALPTGQTTIDVTVKPASTDVSPARNVLLDIQTSSAAISGEIDTMATGGTTAGIDYNTTSA